jgi:hypothetical protein
MTPRERARAFDKDRARELIEDANYPTPGPFRASLAAACDEIDALLSERDQARAALDEARELLDKYHFGERDSLDAKDRAVGELIAEKHIAAMEHEEERDSLKAEVERLREKEKPAITLSFYYMHDRHCFTKLHGDTIDEIIAHANRVRAEDHGGMLCPVVVSENGKEVRRIALGAHCRGLDNDEHWQREVSRWRHEVLADPDARAALNKGENDVEET